MTTNGTNLKLKGPLIWKACLKGIIHVKKSFIKIILEIKMKTIKNICEKLSIKYEINWVLKL